MTGKKIKGGFYLKARQIKDSAIHKAPPYVREIWDYLLREANHRDTKYMGYEIKRGQLFRTYREIRDDLSWKVGYRVERYNENHMKMGMRYLTRQLMITVTKQPRGNIITILNYDYFQNPENYETTNEETTRQPTRQPMPNQCVPSINNNNNNIIIEKKRNITKKRKETLSLKNKFLQRQWDYFFSLSEKLSNWLVNQKNVKINKSKLNSWTKSLVLLYERDLVGQNGERMKRISGALNWYIENAPREYVPVIESGKSFREKFVRLEEAIEREKKRNNSVKGEYIPKWQDDPDLNPQLKREK